MAGADNYFAYNSNLSYDKVGLSIRALAVIMLPRNRRQDDVEMSGERGCGCGCSMQRFRWRHGTALLYTRQ